MDNQKINSKARRRSLSTKQHVNTSSEPEYTGITTQQALIYFAIILACFVVVYPKMIHPMLKYALGFREPPPTESKKSDLPPQLLNRGKPPPGAGPGMRSQPYGRSEGVNTETTKGGSGGGGVMAMVLPLYAGGIFIYLIYTGTKAYKNHGTKKVTKDPHEEVYNLITERLAHLDLEKILSGEDNDGAAEINKLAEMLRDKYNGEGRREDWYDDFEDEVEVIEAASDDAPNTLTSSNPVTKPSLISGVDHKDDTDELLRKCENHEHMTPEEMVRLQKRLLEVESKMNKLVSAIQTVQTKVSDVAEEVIDEISSQENEHNSLTNHNHFDISSAAHQAEITDDMADEMFAEAQSLSSSNGTVEELDGEDISREMDSSDGELSTGFDDVEGVRRRQFPNSPNEC